MPDQPIPLNFRTEVIAPIVKLFQAGESCSVVGVGSSGKSNIARYLARADVRLNSFGRETPNIVALYLNCKPFALRPPHDFYLHMIDQFSKALTELGGAFTAILPAIGDLVNSTEANPETLAKRNLDKAMDLIFQTGAQRMIFLLDDCDDLFGKAQPYLFSDLRSIRDNYKVRVVFLTTTRRELIYLRTSTHEYEEFFELFSAPGHIIALPMYSEQDAVIMLQRLANRQDPPRVITDDLAKRIYMLSGGHAGLLRSIFFTMAQGMDVMLADAVYLLAAKGDIQDECEKIMTSLESDEQSILRRIADGNHPSELELRHIQKRYLITMQYAIQPQIFSPVFAKFLGQKVSTPVPNQIPIEFTGVGCQVRVYGDLVNALTHIEYALSRYLYDKRPQVCSRAEMIEALRAAEQTYSNEMAHGSPLRRLDQYLLEMRAKLGPAGDLIRPAEDGWQMIQ